MPITLRSRQVLDWIGALAVAVVSALVIFWQNSRLTVLWDLSYILENSYRISLGQVPYRDFPFPYAPLTFLTQAALIKLTGRVFFHHVIYCAMTGALATLLTWRIIRHILNDTPRGHYIALVLTLPLAVLGIYDIFPHPFYDCDCTFVMLLCLLLLIRWSSKAPLTITSFLAGAALVLPIFIKQNVGLVFTGTTVGSLVLMFLLDGERGQKIRGYAAVLAGVTVSFVVALVLIQRIAGLGNYIQWTVRFAAQRRTPALREMIGVYGDRNLKWWLVLLVAGIVCGVLARRFKSTVGKLLSVLSLPLISIPVFGPIIYLFLDNDSSERAERLINLWPLMLIVAAASILFSFQKYIRRDRSTTERIFLNIMLPVIIIATTHGAFMSQQLWGSTYALWPLFLILAAVIISTFASRPRSSQSESFANTNRQRAIGDWRPLILASVIAVSLLISGIFYIRSHERLDYADLDDGDLMHSSLPQLRGLAMRGEFVKDFEELVAYTNKEIPHGDGILYLPGEDLFYYTTGRTPKFPVVMIDHTINPYSPQEIVDIARERNIQWLIVKDELQLEEEPIEKKDELMALLEKEFESVESLNNYEIYKRKSPEDKESDEDDDDDDADKADSQTKK